MRSPYAPPSEIHQAPIDSASRRVSKWLRKSRVVASELIAVVLFSVFYAGTQTPEAWDLSSRAQTFFWFVLGPFAPLVLLGGSLNPWVGICPVIGVGAVLAFISQVIRPSLATTALGIVAVLIWIAVGYASFALTVFGA